MAGPIKRNKSSEGNKEFETAIDDKSVTVYRRKEYEKEGKMLAQRNKESYPELTSIQNEKFERGNAASSDAIVTKKSDDPQRTYKNLKNKAKKDVADFNFFKHTTKGK